ncbi:Na+/H+ antiporter subunit E [Acinetobacter sp. LoGeW2-3]|uniref:Na+/H+ antiporter subunit E n=1 Tax=Acinetobacter sp. LoGeW2-3 TaxID=1808001 RepID=UPI000C05B713|nr:Na+/H+ antiporter subunit E [Acinetobacter sp. LoGeW2-3]ATO19386.1 Na+/H+ antiporter subunit E [Acinetobacter sp. LoGeW2-3]
MKESFLRRWFPHPLVSVIVGVSWTLLNHSLDAGTLVTALFLAVLIPRMVFRFIDYTPNIHWLPAIRLFFVVIWDVIVANIKVAILVLGPTKNLHPKWFRVPLETEHEEVNALLAMIITTTPGTVSAGIDQDRGDILVHALSTDDEAAEIETIKQRYERPLIEIFSAQTGEKA